MHRRGARKMNYGGDGGSRVCEIAVVEYYIVDYDACVYLSC